MKRIARFSRIPGIPVPRIFRLRLPVFLVVCLSLCMGLCGSLLASTTGYAQQAQASLRQERSSGETPAHVVGYYTSWSVYNGYLIKNLVSSGSASKMTVLNYAFANVGTNLQCSESDSDPWADYQRPFSASESVNGVADSSGQALMGNFNQIKELKALYPNLKAIISIGGWTWSAHFSDAALTPQSRAAFVQSCINQYILGNLNGGSGGPGIGAGVFDGIDIDWEYPAAPGNTGNVYRPQDTRDFTLLLAEFRKQLDALGKQTGQHYLLSFEGSAGKADYSKLELNKVWKYVDWINLMTYDYNGPWETNGPTNFNAPLYTSPKDPTPVNQRQSIDTTVNAYLKAGVPASKLNMGIPFYGHGWTNVPDANHGLYQGNANTQPAPGVAEAGTNNFNVLEALTGYTSYRDPITKAFWIFNGTTFWSYDDPIMLLAKMQYVRARGLGGAMIWSMDGDDASGTLISALYNGLQGKGWQAPS